MNGGAAGKEAKEARAAEDARQSQIRSGTNKINWIFDNEFTPSFFRQRGRAYSDFAKPQVNDQYKDAGDALTFDLARRGLTDSSVRGEKTADLQKLYDTQMQDVAGKARQTSTDAMNDVADAKTGLVTTLQQTGDAAGAAHSAIDRADALSQQPSYSPLSNLFLDFTDTLGAQAALERNYAAGGPAKPRYNLGLYGGNGSSGSVRVS